MTAKRDPFPSDAAIQEANAALVNVVRRHFPMGFYRQNTNWELWSAALLVRMTEVVESAMTLMKGDHEPDGRILVRALYEQVVTYAWIAIDPGPRWRRWFNQGLWDDLKLHNDAKTFAERTLSEEEVRVTKTTLGLDRPSPGAKKKRKRPDPGILLPAVTDRARESDEYWAERIAGLHPAGHLLSFRGLYLPAFRTASRAVHTSIGGLGAFVTEKRNRQEVAVPESQERLMWALVAPLFGIGLMIAAQETWWINANEVREVVDMATGTEPKEHSS